jgi:beta-glucanase (GH16 family)
MTADAMHGLNKRVPLLLGATIACGLFNQSTAQVWADPVQHPVIGFVQQDFCEHAPWRLVFEDEFNGDALNTDTWLRFYPYCNNADECEASRTHGLPDELQIFTDENVVLTGEGTVKLIAKKGPLTSWYSATSNYTSGMLHSRMQFNRGRFECRCKVPKSTSHYLWPAFWLFGGGPACSEIDILEILWDHSTMYHHSLHRYNNDCNGNHASDQQTHELGELSDEFHIYRADWDTWFVNFYIDEVLIYRACRIVDLLNRPVSNCEVPGGVYIQNQAFPGHDAYVSIIVGLGLHRGSPALQQFAGPEIPDLPAAMEIDHVRVYQR